MNEHRLTADERTILDRALEHEGPSSERIERIHRDVARAIAAGAVGAAAATATAQAVAATTAETAAKAGGFALSATAKFWLANVLIVGGLAGAGAVAGVAARPEVAPPPAAAAPATTDADPLAHGTVPASREREVGDPPAEPPAGDLGDEAPPTDTAASSTATPSASPATLDDEVELLARAQQRLRDGDPDGALRLLNEHARSFPRGALGPEAEAARVLALCHSGRRAEARAAAARFVAASPRSPLAERVRNACP